MTEGRVAWHQLGITPQMVYEQMGYGEAMPTADVARETLAVLQRAADVAQPCYCFTVVQTLPPFTLGKVIERQLRGSEAYALFLCTAGTAYEALQAGWHEDELRRFIADAVGSVIAERTADVMEQALQATIDKLGWQHTSRFSPGYCGWSVAEQQLLFPYFGHPNPCNIQLLESSLMLPIKSVSGLIGIGRSVRHLPYTCALCQMADCYKRRQSASSPLPPP